MHKPKAAEEFLPYAKQALDGAARVVHALEECLAR